MPNTAGEGSFMDPSKQRWKRIARMHALRDRIAEWAARNKPAELQEGIRRYLGPHAPGEELVMQGVGFALVATPPGGSSLIHRYLPFKLSRWKRRTAPRRPAVVFWSGRRSAGRA